MRILPIALLAATPSFALGQDAADQAPTIVVTGSAFRDARPDAVVIFFSVTAREDSPGKAVDRSARLADEVSQAFAALAIPGLQVEQVGYAAGPVWDSRDGERRFNGYEARTTFRVGTALLAEAGRIVQAGTSAGATLGGVDYTSTELETVRRAALAAAVRAARADAEALASGAVGNLGRLLLLTTEDLDPRPGTAIGIQALRATESPRIDPQPIRVTARVQGRWEFVPGGPGGR